MGHGHVLCCGVVMTHRAAWLLLLLFGCGESVVVDGLDAAPQPPADDVTEVSPPVTSPSDCGPAPPSDCSDPCAFCDTYVCEGGVWLAQENAPSNPPWCDPVDECDPLGQDCEDDLHCVLIDEADRFGFVCRTPGPIDTSEGACDTSDDCGLATGRSMSCLNTDSGGRECRVLCDPSAPEADGLCGGACVALSRFGYPLDSVGACEFLGG